MASPNKCVTCGDKFIGRGGARYCSPACKQRAHRGRQGGNRNASRAQRVTVTEAPKRSRRPRRSASGGHCQAAMEVLAALDAEMAEASDECEEPLEWTAAEAAVRELIACEFDRKTDLEKMYREADDAKTRVKLSAELRLLEASTARLLKQVKTKLPEQAVSRRTQKAQRAARTRWDRNA